VQILRNSINEAVCCEKPWIEFMKNHYITVYRTLIKPVVRSERLTIFLCLLMSLLLMIVEAGSVILMVPLLQALGLSGGQGMEKLNVLAKTVIDATNIAPNIMLLLPVVVCFGAMQGWINKTFILYNSRLTQRITTRMSGTMFTLIAGASWRWAQRRGRSALYMLIMRDSNAVGGFVAGVLQMVTAICKAGVQLIMALLISLPATIVALAAGVIIAVARRPFLAKQRVIGEKTLELSQIQYHEMFDYLGGLKEVKGYGQEKQHELRFNEVTERVGANNVRKTELSSSADFINRLIVIGFTAVFVLVYYKIFGASLAEIMVILYVFNRLQGQIKYFQSFFESLVDVAPTMKQLSDCLSEFWDVQTTVPDTDARTDIDSLRLDEVCFQYDSQTGFELGPLTAEIPAGKITALAGISGSGKTTSGDLLLGLLFPDSGELLVNDKQLQGEELAKWRNSVGYVAQQPYIFHGSIRANLLWANAAATDAELWQALDMARFAKRVRSMNNGLDSWLGEDGEMLSGGEKQRLAIARALVRKPALLVMDEATSMLDIENEHEIRQSLLGLRGKMTIVMIAHRLYTLKTADQILLLEHGKIIERGTYDELAVLPTGRFAELLNYGVL